MVNDNRLKILELLRQNKTISGSETARILGLSRVAVWKHINRLEQAGYIIHSDRNGYSLVSESDKPIPEAFGRAGGHIEYFDSISSTMDKARDAAFAGCAPETVFIAGEQTKGRGRNNKTWDSAAGGLYFTMVTRPDDHPRYAYLHSVRAAVSLCSVLNEKYLVPAMFKWPNDIFVNGKKTAGILMEFFAQGNKISFANIGIGVNVHNPASLSTAENLDAFGSGRISRIELLRLFLEDFGKRENPREICPAADKYSYLGSRKIKALTTGGDLVSGHSGAVTPEGNLVIKTDSGPGRTLDFGDEIIHIEGLK